MTVTSGPVNVPIWSYGRAYSLRLDKETFERFYYGALIVKRPR